MEFVDGKTFFLKIKLAVAGNGNKTPQINKTI
jgi:hypothetical protein